MNGSSLATLVHLLGFVTGAALYAMLLALALRLATAGRSGSASNAPGRIDRLALLTATLGLTWNVIGLLAFGVRDLGIGAVPPFLTAIAYCALGFLPAAVVHSLLTSEVRRSGVGKTLIAIPYGVSTVAAMAMLWSARTGVVPSRPALQALTWTFVAMALPLLFLTRRQARFTRAWWIIALAMFAVSALHLSGPEHGADSWWIQLIGHHASLALVFAILYQDYRFALADLFLKRGLTLFVVIAAVAGLFIGILQPMFAAKGASIDPLLAGTLMVMWVATALLYPSVQRGVAWFVDRVILQRSDYNILKTEIARSAAQIEEIEPLLDVVCALLAPALTAEEVHWQALLGDVVELEENVVANRYGADFVVPVPTAEAPRYALVIGRLAGGRRLLSDDVEMLQTAARMLGRRVDAIRIQRERFAQNAREQEISKLATEAELRALRAQINPHFLFNALNTIGYLVQTSPDVAQTTLMKLTSLLRGVLRSGSSFVTLGEEIDLISSYLDIEKARFEERLRVRIDVPEALRHARMPSLLLQPLVENALKHGIASSRSGGSVTVAARFDESMIVLTVRNSGELASELEIARGKRQGVGLRNIEERLRLYFGDRASLLLHIENDGMEDDEVMVAEIRLPKEPAGSDANGHGKREQA